MDDKALVQSEPLNLEEVPTPPARPRTHRKRPTVLSKPRPVTAPKSEEKAPWVVLWASKDNSHRVLLGCERCGTRLSFPYKSPVHRAEEALIGFRMDHENCKEGDLPKAEPPAQASPRKH
jgi:hypothetical protein